MTYFELFQTERVCRRQFQIRYKWHKVLKTDRKCCGKRKNCLSQEFYPVYTTVFKILVLSRHVKTRACWGEGYYSKYLLQTWYHSSLSNRKHI